MRYVNGTAPTVESVQRKCEQMLHRQHLRQLVQITVSLNPAGVPQLSYEADPAAQCETHFATVIERTGRRHPDQEPPSV